MRRDIRICGKGGQGIMLAGYILGKAASVFHEYNSVQMLSYGPEARGGAARSEVVISDEEIGYCGLYSAEYMMVISQEAHNKYTDDLADDAVVVLDPDLVPHADMDDAYEIPVTRLAEELGNKIVANIIMLGAFNEVAELVPEQALRDSVKDSVPGRFIDLNMKAVDTGIEYFR